MVALFLKSLLELLTVPALALLVAELRRDEPWTSVDGVAGAAGRAGLVDAQRRAPLRAMLSAADAKAKKDHVKVA